MSQYATYPSLKGRRVLITGGASGIGESVVARFAAQALQRHLLPEEVSRLAPFVAAEDSNAMAGQSNIVDGGWV